MRIEDMTSEEIRNKQKETRTVIVPISPIEQHGPHLTISPDHLIGYEVSRKAAEETGVFCLPPLTLGYNHKGSSFPGTVSISTETLKSVVRDLCSSLERTGFRRIIIISGHAGGGHVRAIKETVEGHDNISFFTVRDLTSKVVGGLIDTKDDRHAGEKETSLMLYLAPGHVRMDRAVSSFPDYPDDITPEEYMRGNPSGVYGDPTKATKEKGEKLFRTAVEELAGIIGEK